jgi:hypothetical protein
MLIPISRRTLVIHIENKDATFAPAHGSNRTINAERRFPAPPLLSDKANYLHNVLALQLYNVITLQRYFDSCVCFSFGVSQ